MEKLLLERLSLRSICRIMEVSMGWLTYRLKARWQEQAYKLPIGSLAHPEVKLLAVEADELWSFVGNKHIQQWVWLAIERRSGLVLGFYIGDRSAASAECLWYSIDPVIRSKALFFSDDWDAYGRVIPAYQHTTGKADTPIIERFNNTLRQRCSRLVRKTLSFSKSVENHYQAILFFLRHHNFEILAKNPSL
jgi:insertion element IS1 protein InsB